MNEKCVFVPGRLRVHLCPKVASRSMFEAFHQERQASVTDVNGDGGEWRFHCVRHPLDRLVSLWSYFCVGDGLRGQPQVEKLGYWKGQAFPEFLDVVCERHDQNIHTRMQVAFRGPRDADQLIRYERLGEEWTDLVRRFPDIKIMRELPRIHQTSHRTWMDYYTDDLRGRATDVFAADLELYARAR